MSGKGARKTVYLSNMQDKDIIEYVHPLLSKYGFSSVIKELVRDGIQFRSRPKNNNVIQSSTPDFSEVKLEKKEFKPEDIDKSLDLL